MTIEATVAALVESELCRLVITGGEPLLQQPALSELLRLLSAEIFIEVETNATIVPAKALLDRVNQWNLSPKLASSGQLHHEGQNLDALRAFLPVPNAFLKLVIAEHHDLVEADELVKSLDWPKTRVVFMPEGRTQETLAERSPWVADAAVRRGHRFSTRLQILLWGDERGR